MQTIAKPILAIIFIFCLMWFLNFVFIFINQTQIQAITQKVIFVVEKYDGYTNEAAYEINEIFNESSKDYKISVSNPGNLNYGETTEVIIQYKYEYFGFPGAINMQKSAYYIGKEI